MLFLSPFLLFTLFQALFVKNDTFFFAFLSNYICLTVSVNYILCKKGIMKPIFLMLIFSPFIPFNLFFTIFTQNETFFFAFFFIFILFTIPVNHFGFYSTQFLIPFFSPFWD